MIRSLPLLYLIMLATLFSCKKKATSKLNATTRCKITMNGHKKVELNQKVHVTIPIRHKYAYLSGPNQTKPQPLAEGAVKKVYPGVDLDTNESKIIGVPHCADTGACPLEIGEDFNTERLLDERLIGPNGTMVDVFTSDEGIPLIVKDFASGDTIKSLIKNGSWNANTKTLKIGTVDIPQQQFNEAMWEMILAISNRPIKGNNRIENLQEYLSIANYHRIIDDEATSLSLQVTDLNPANLIAQVSDGKLVIKIVDGNAAILNTFGVTNTRPYLIAIRENTWEVIKNIEGTRAFGYFPDRVLNWFEKSIPGIKNVPPARNDMEKFMTDLREYLWAKQQEQAKEVLAAGRVPEAK